MFPGIAYFKLHFLKICVFRALLAASLNFSSCICANITKCGRHIFDMTYYEPMEPNFISLKNNWSFKELSFILNALVTMVTQIVENVFLSIHRL